MTPSPILMIAIFSVALMGVAVYLLIADRRIRSHRTRIDGVLSAYAPAIMHAPTVGLSGSEKLLQSASINSILDLFRIQPMRPDLYPAPWWVIAGGVGIAALVVTGVAELLVGPLAWLAIPVIWFILMRFVFSSFLSRRAGLLYNQLPDALSMVVRSVRAGLPVPEALRVVAEEAQFPTSVEFGRLYDDLRVGGSMSDALMKLAGRTGLLEYRFFAVSLSLQSQSGGSLTETLDNLADVIRKRVALKHRAIALASEAKMTMYVLAGLPFVAAGALMVLNPDYLLVLFTTSMGRFILFTGVALLSMGIGSMRIIIKKSVS